MKSHRTKGSGATVLMIGAGLAFVYVLPWLEILIIPQFWQLVITGVLLIYGFMWVVSFVLGGGEDEKQ